MKIEILFPEFGNLFGDSSNIKYLKKCMPDAEIINTAINTTPKFINEHVDFIYLGPMTERAQEIVIEKLKPYKQRIEELIDKNVIFLWTGNSIEILGKYIENEDGSKIEGLGIFDIYAKRDMLKRKNCIVLGRFENIQIVGFQSQFTTLHGNIEKNHFLDLEIGIGIHENPKLEGIRKNNFFGTYLIGPILILNPLFTKKILEIMGYEKPQIVLEKEIMNAYKKRLEEFKDLIKKWTQNSKKNNILV